MSWAGDRSLTATPDLLRDFQSRGSSVKGRPRTAGALRDAPQVSPSAELEARLAAANKVLRSAHEAWVGLEPLSDWAADPIQARRIQVADLAERLESTEAYA